MGESTSRFITAAVLSVLNMAAMAWLLARRRAPVVANRGYVLALVGVAFASLHAALLLIHDGIDDTASPAQACHLTFWTSTLFVPICLSSYILRCYHLYFQARLSVSKARYLETHRSDFFLRRQWTDASSTLWAALAAYALAWLVIMAAIIYGGGGASEPAAGPFADVVDDGNCLVRGTVVAVMVQSVIALAVLFVFVVLLWSVDDAFYIKHELRLVGWATLALTVCWALAEQTALFADPLASLYIVVTMSEVFVVASCLLPAALSHRHARRASSHAVVASAGIVELWTIERAERAHSEALAAFMADLPPAPVDDADNLKVQATGGVCPPAQAPPAHSPSNFSLSADLLHTVLDDPELLASFKQFAVRSWCVENLLFVIEVEHFRAHAHNRHASLVGRARKLVQAFIAEASPLQLNLLQATQCDVLNRLERGDISADLFDDAFVEVAKQLRYDTLAKWRQSESGRMALSRVAAV